MRAVDSNGERCEITACKPFKPSVYLWAVALIQFDLIGLVLANIHRGDQDRQLSRMLCKVCKSLVGVWVRRAVLQPQ